MYIEIAQDDRGVSTVKILHSEGNGSEQRIDMTLQTEQVVIVEVGSSAQVMLARTRTNGTKIEADTRTGDAWLTGRNNRRSGMV